jgi:hypothetical protein
MDWLQPSTLIKMDPVMQRRWTWGSAEQSIMSLWSLSCQSGLRNAVSHQLVPATATTASCSSSHTQHQHLFSPPKPICHIFKYSLLRDCKNFYIWQFTNRELKCVSAPRNLNCKITCSTAAASNQLLCIVCGEESSYSHILVNCKMQLCADQSDDPSNCQKHNSLIPTCHVYESCQYSSVL